MTVGLTELPPEGMQLGGVALAGDAERGTRTTEGLSLLFTTAGITVQGPQPQIERLLVWSGLDSATCDEKTVLSDGRSAAIMELTSGGQAIRFILPADTVSPGQAAFLGQALPAWLTRYHGPVSATPASPVAGEAVAAAGVAAAGVVAAESASAATEPAAAPLGGIAPPAAEAAATAPTAPAPTAPSAPDAVVPAPAPSAPAAPLGGVPATPAAPSTSTAPTAPPTPPAAPAAATPAPPVATPPPVSPATSGAPSAVTPPMPPAPPLGVVAPPGAPLAPLSWDNPPLGQSLGDDMAQGGAKKKFSFGRKAKGAAAGVAALGATDAVSALAGAPEAPHVGTEEPFGTTTLLPEDDKPKTNRSLLTVLVAAVVVLAAVGGLLIWKKSQNSQTSPTPGVSSVVPVQNSADLALATGISLAQTDLPAGWTPAAGVIPVRPPVPPVSAKVAAAQSFASCTGATQATVAGLFAGAPLIGQTAEAHSANFAEGGTTDIVMHSTTSVLSSVPAVAKVQAPFAAPTFTSCFQQYQSAVVAAAAPGATASVQVVTLTPPTGVTAYGYLTTVTLPGNASEVIGQAFIFGGRTVTQLETTTSGAAVPSTAFEPAFTGVSQRVAAALTK